jgi:nucleotide-binding universal stress UspA family protein
MESILVASDFSNNSKVAIRFAIQLERQGKFSPTFLHVTEILKPIKWSDKFFKDFELKEMENLAGKLRTFVAAVYKKAGIKIEDFNVLVKNSTSVKKSIILNAEKGKFSYICISSKGAGNPFGIFGSTSSALITGSTIPVIAVPVKYKAEKISSICYASDLVNLDKELQQVLKFTAPLESNVELLHFKIPADLVNEQQQIDELQKRLANENINTRLEDLNIENSLVENLNKVIKKSRPSMLIMFTEQKRTFFERLFLSSKSSEFAQTSKIPLLIFSK